MKEFFDNLEIREMKQKITLLEEKVFGKAKRLRRTEAQRFLIFYFLGFIDKIIELQQLSQNDKDILVSVMLDIDPDNSRKFIAELNRKEKPLLYTKTNFQFLLEFFEHIKYGEKAKEIEKILSKILNKKEEKG